MHSDKKLLKNRQKFESMQLIILNNIIDVYAIQDTFKIM